MRKDYHISIGAPPRRTMTDKVLQEGSTYITVCGSPFLIWSDFYRKSIEQLKAYPSVKIRYCSTALQHRQKAARVLYLSEWKCEKALRII